MNICQIDTLDHFRRVRNKLSNVHPNVTIKNPTAENVVESRHRKTKQKQNNFHTNQNCLDKV